MSVSIDLNADLGELPGAEGRASDTAVLSAVTSCAIACGGHAGDEAIMEATLLAAQKHGVAAGAHPAYPDRNNFGRLSMTISTEALGDTLRDQLQTLQTVAERTGVPLTHVKPHGALYNDAAQSSSIAEAVSQAVKFCFGTRVALIGPPKQETEKAALAAGLRFHAEGFIDRAYMSDGKLMPRSQAGAVLQSDAMRVAQARQIVLKQQVTDPQGIALPLVAQTLCLHGDGPEAAETARAVKAALEADGVVLSAIRMCGLST